MFQKSKSAAAYKILVCRLTAEAGRLKREKAGQDAVDPDGELLGQRHVNDDWQNAEQESS